ncbi:MAG: tetratricopeptide repeat protein, partial [Bacteroidetes bacterium]|nr:tetratricopeptide repeat protein [Bacteroidota bacterium]
MRILKPLSFFAIAALLTLAACKGFKNTPVGRFYHNMVAHYNGYFNANDKMTEIENALYDKTEDNYSTIISIFPMGKEADSKAFTADLDKSIVRCSKVITKHELSNWVDDAYLLVGKSYFYKRDYFAAMETFQYTALKFPNTIPGQEAMFWTIRCYIELNKLTDAQAQISEVKKIKNINPKIEYKLNVVMADYYMHSEEYKLAAEHLEKAMKFIPTRKYRLRYYFILGQLYAWVGENTKAVANYTQVVKRNASYDLTFQAKMGLAGLYATQNPKEKKNIRKYLDRLLKDTKNTQYLDQVYYQLAKIELGEGHKKQGIDFLKQSSAHSNAKNKFQKTMTLVMLADLYFKEPDYATAKNYYDSTLASLQKEYPKSEQFGKEKKIYSELSGHLYNINREDSLQKIAAMPEAERTKKILEIMEKEKQDAEQKKLDDAKQKKQQEDNKSQLFGGVNDDNGNSDDMNNQMMNNGGVNQMGNNQQNSGQNNQQTAPLTTLSGNNDW